MESISTQIRGLIQAELEKIAELSVVKEPKNNEWEAIIYMITDNYEDGDEGARLNINYMGFEIHIIGRNKEVEDVLEFADRVRIVLKKLQTQKLNNFTTPQGIITATLNRLILDSTAKPVDFGHDLGLAVLGRAKLTEIIK